MATTWFLLTPITLCCFLFLLAVAEQSKVNATVLVVYGTAKCKSNSSRIITNAPMHLVINNATVPGGTGMTTVDGQIVITVHLSSAEQLAALMSHGSSRVFLTAPPHACGAPGLLPKTMVAAAVRPTAVIAGNNDGGLQGDAANKEDVVRLSGLVRIKAGDASHLTGLDRVVFAGIECFACEII